MGVRCALEELRGTTDVSFKQIFKDIIEFAAKVEMSMPRFMEDKLIIFKMSVYLPLLDYIIQALHTRFEDNSC